MLITFGRVPLEERPDFWISRLGAGIDNKTWFLDALHAYENKHQCVPYSIYPPTVELSDGKDCVEFFTNNSKWARSREALWFIKASDGSTGRHISLMRRRDIERSKARMSNECPLKGGIASLEVPNLYTINNKKFDNRVFVLVPSIEVCAAAACTRPAWRVESRRHYYLQACGSSANRDPGRWGAGAPPGGVPSCQGRAAPLAAPGGVGAPLGGSLSRQGRAALGQPPAAHQHGSALGCGGFG